jgi:hypothetical protein
MPERLYDPQWWQQTISQGLPLSFQYKELPVEELLVLDEYCRRYPGMRFNLRRQRGRYLLTLLPSRHLEDEEAKGEP